MIESFPQQREAIIRVQNLYISLNHQAILKDINLDVYRDEIFGIVGESGCGKTTLLRTILMLLTPQQGSIEIFHKKILKVSEKEANTLQHRWGVMFQQSALFSSLTVLENVLFPLRYQTSIPSNLQKEMAFLKISLAGLPIAAATKYPSELSGGMQKRAALARAIALDPELLFLDEPTSGLDPHSANELDELILDLRKALNLTIIVVTHDLDTLGMVTDRVAFLGQGEILSILPIKELVNEKHPAIKEYFTGVRANRVKEAIKAHSSESREENNKNRE